MADKVKVSESSLDQHIKMAYEYAHANCRYGPTDTCFMAMDNGLADCVGLYLRAAATMGWLHSAKNINQAISVCESKGLKRSEDINDVWRHHGVVFMAPCGDRANVAHVFYSLGGKKEGDKILIDKFDLGNDARIAAAQPYHNVAPNEWPGKRDFLCIYYVPGKTYPDPVPAYDDRVLTGGTVRVRTGLYAGPGTAYKRLGTAKAGSPVVYGPIVSNMTGRYWRRCRVGSTWGWIYFSAVVQCLGLADPWTVIVKQLPDGYAAIRAGAGIECPEVGRISSGQKAEANGTAIDSTGRTWVHIRKGNLYGYCSDELLEKIN